jgi:hypothetical protein
MKPTWHIILSHLHARISLFFVIAVLSFNTVSGQIVVDQTATGSVEGSKNLTVNHTVSTGLSNSVVVVSLLMSTPLNTLNNLTYGGLNLTFIESSKRGSLTLVVYTLINPPAGTNALTINTNSNTDITLAVTSFGNVDQDNIFSSIQKVNGNSGNISKTIDCNENSFAIDFLSLEDKTAIEGPGQTVLVNHLNPNGADRLLSSYKVATSGTDNLSWNFSGTNYNYIWGCLNPFLDFDGDGIADSVDLDDDNDGILDTAENNILSYGGFEYVTVPNNGNNQAAQGVNSSSILPWILIPGGLGSGGTPNIVQVDGDVYNYGNGGPPFDADPNSNFAGIKQHYFDINGNADIYQSFKITSTTNITYSGYFTPRDNNNTATAKLAIYSGIGNNNTGATLVTDTGTISIPVQNGSSKATPWKLVQGTVTLSPGTYSFVVTMSNYGNFDEGSVKVTGSNLDTDGDGIANIFDLDSDNDGIYDAEEAGHGKGHINGVVSNTVGTDGIPDIVQNSPNIGTVNYVVAESSMDSDYILNYLDIDSDGDGIPDNIEAQPTIGYIPPSNVSANITDLNANGVDDVYESAMGGTDITQLEDTDGDGIKDYLDNDSNNDGILDIDNNGQSNAVSNIDIDNDGLDDNMDAITAYLDVNDEVSSGNLADLVSVFGDANNNINSGGDLDYRDYFDIIPPSRATLYFDGINDYVSGDSFTNGLNELTVMAWVKSDNGNSTNMVITGEDIAFKLWLQNGNQPAFSISTNGSSQQTVGGCSCSTINFNEWHHLVGSFSANTGLIKLYLDGVLLDSKSITGLSLTASNDTSGVFEIGRFSNKLSNGQYFKGAIDEVRVFNTLLTDDQIQKMVYQEIEENSGNVKGTIVPKDIMDVVTNNTVSWTNLLAYYPMTEIKSSKILDYSGNNNTIRLHNITTVQDQTAPIPYATSSNGTWTAQSTWLHGDIWDIEDPSSIKDWMIVRVSDDITVNHDVKTAGLIIDANKTLTVTGDQEVKNSWYLELNGTLDLQDDSQLIQTEHSDLVTSADGKILRRQEGVASSYWYNYWGSPVGAPSATSLSDNNTSSNNPNNTDFKLELLKDSAGLPVQFTSSYSQAGYISTYWLYTFMNGVTYWDWVRLQPTTGIKPGVGYTQKGTDSGGLDEQYIFEGKPNNGTILVDVTDTGGPGSVVSESATNYLFGNPYPSALDIHKFIDDNAGVISGTLQLWQQWSGSSHYLNEYNGGYAQVNKLGSTRAYQFVGFYGSNNGSQDGTKTPTRYLPVGQGFIAEVIADGQVEFNNTQRLFIKEADFTEGDYNSGSVFMKSGSTKSKETDNKQEKEEADPFQKIRLEFNSVTGPETRRELLLGFSEITSDDFDYGYDAECGDSNNNDLNLNFEGKNMNIQAYGAITDDKIVPLNFKSSGDNSFEIKITALENMAGGQKIYLRDHLTGDYFDLTTEEPYQFNATQGKFNNRFEIVFQSENQTLSAEEVIAEDNVIYYQHKTKLLYAKKLKGDVQRFALVNTLGQYVMELADVSQSILESGLQIPNVSTGTYIAVFRTDDNQVVTKKIIVN